jgi:hypothetical protein
MATRGFSCSNCHTWFEGDGNHPKCPLCGTRASPRDLLEARQRPDAPAIDGRPASQSGYETPPPPPDYETPAGFEWPRDREEPAGFEVPRDREEPADFEVPRDHDESAAPTQVQTPEASEGEGRLGQLIGVVLFVAIIASQVCRALTDSE